MSYEIKREINLNEAAASEVRARRSYANYDDGIVYVNFSLLSTADFTSKLSLLESAKAIIIDNRSYPIIDKSVLSHFLEKNDTTRSWLRIPYFIYPDQENIAGYEDNNWSLKPKLPYLGSKPVYILIGGRTISYGESLLGYFEGYQIATSVGEPSAGTNGNVNPFDLLGGLQVRWTGMKVVKHDGSQLQGVGFEPDVLVKKTKKGIIEGRDEVLGKALELAREAIGEDQ